jgi:hypothetical protein
MTTTEAILHRLQALPETARLEILDFVEFLEARRYRSAVREEDSAWSAFSLASAMRGMEDEETPYTLADLRESFR